MCLMCVGTEVELRVNEQITVRFIISADKFSLNEDLGDAEEIQRI